MMNMHNHSLTWPDLIQHVRLAQSEDKAPPMVEDRAPDYERKEFFPLKVNHPMINASSDHP